MLIPLMVNALQQLRLYCLYVTTYVCLLQYTAIRMMFAGLKFTTTIIYYILLFIYIEVIKRYSGLLYEVADCFYIFFM